MKSSHSKSTLHIFTLASLLISLISGAVFVTPVQAVTHTVSDCAAPSGAAGRLVDEITAASSGDTINFSCSGTITLAATITIAKNLTMDGTGQTVTISGNNAVRVMQVSGGTALTLNNLTIANGSVTSDNGGGIYSSGTLTITNSTFFHNSATSFLGGGGGIYSDAGTLTVTNSTFSNNIETSSLSGGGGIYNNVGTASITNSTFSGNSAPAGFGGGIYNNAGTVTIRNTIVANNSGGSCGGVITDSGNNIDDGETCGWGVSASGTKSNTNPNLGPLANNGGPTQTFALFTGSPAIDGVTFNGSNGAPSTDQRGVARPHGAGYDIGAFEAEVQTGPTLIVNTIADTDDGSCDLLGQGISNKDCTLREAINAANAQAGANTITFSVSGTIKLGSTLPNITAAGGALTMDGTGRTVVISGGSAVRVLSVDASASLTLNNLTIANGKYSGGGGVLNGGTLTITNSTFSGNSGGIGGGIYNFGTTNITNSTFSGNSAVNSAGGVYNFGTTNITNSTFSGNSAASGGGIENNGGTLTITNSTFSGNSSTGLTSAGGGIFTNFGITTITNSTFSGNSASADGGGVSSNGMLAITNSVFSGNSATAGGGGGIYIVVGTATITNSTFSGNSATQGGGVFTNGGTQTTITNSTFSINSATSSAGGVGTVVGTLIIANSTFSNNSANFGGGIENNSGTATILNSTFSGNSDSGWGAAVATWNGGITPRTTIRNTILANSAGFGFDCYNPISGTLIGSNNIIEKSSSCTSIATITSDPNLGALANNGGPTQTFALLTGSPALNTGNDAICAAAPVSNTSQNGVTRPQGPHCDIGAFELRLFNIFLPLILR